MFTLQLPSSVPATWLLPMLGMALLSLLTCGSGLWGASRLRRGSLPLVHAILVVSLLMPLAAPLAWVGFWVAGWSPLRFVSTTSQSARTPSPATVEVRSSVPAPPSVIRRETAEPVPARIALPDRSAEATSPLPEAVPLLVEHNREPTSAPVASWLSEWRGVRGIERAIVTIWLAGTAYQLAWLAWGLRRVRRFRRTIQTETDPELLSVLLAAAEQLGMTSCPALGRSAATDTPLSLGLWRPQIVLPAEHDEARWVPEAWRPLLVHELAHVQRQDHLVGLMQRLVLASYWWNPLAWAVSRELSLVRELICDDIATGSLTANNRSADAAVRSRQYAGLLIDLAERVADRADAQPDYVAVLAAWNGPRDDLSRRIHRLLDPSRQVVTTLNRRAKIACGGFSLALLLLVWVACVRVDQVAAEPPMTAAAGKAAVEPAAAGGDAEPAVELLEQTILVVDPDGQPIAGVQVLPTGLSLANGSSMSWTDGRKMSSPEPLTTDEQGVVVIRYPQYGLPNEQATRGLFCHLEHSDYAAKRSELIDLIADDPGRIATVRLSPGAQVELVPRLHGQLVTGGKLFADWTSRAFAPHLMATTTTSGHLKLPRLNPGTEIVRVAYISEAGERYFSRAERLELKEGEHRLVDVVLEPAVVVHGKLDDRVPRPVTGGRVLAIVAETGESNVSQVWQSYSHIDPEGNFSLGWMPRGTLELTALCDGYMAKPDGAAAGATETEVDNWFKQGGRPQRVELSGDHAEIAIAMTPTATAEVRLLSPQGQPVPNTWLTFNPNVRWSHGGSQIYCYPLISSWETLLDPPSIGEPLFDWSAVPFNAGTNIEGVAVVHNLPPGLQSFGFAHDQFQLEREDNSPYSNFSIELVAGEKNEFSFTLQAKQDPVTSDLIPAAQETIYCGPGVSQLVKPRPKQTFATQAAETELAGVVVDAEGNPLAGVEVDVGTWHPGNETTTDEQGRFRLTGLDRLSEVEVEFSKPGYCPSFYPAQKTGTQNWTVVLTNDTYREGQVLSPEGQPVPYALVRAARGPFQNPHVRIKEVWTGVTTDADGRYRLYLEPYNYEIQVRVPKVGSYRQAALQVERGSTDQLDLTLEKGLTFKALVLHSETGQPVEGIQLWNWQHPGVEGTSAAEGLIEIDGMSPGEFEFRVTAVGVDRRRSSIAGQYARWWSRAAVHEHQRKETETAGQFPRNLDDLTFDIQPGGEPVEIFVEPVVTITGQVLDPEGKPVKGATVAPARGDGNSLTSDTRYSYPTDAEGRFTMYLPASHHTSYNLIVHDGEYNQWRHWASGITEPFQTVPGQVIEGMQLAMTRGATVRGQVVDVLGRPKPHTQVRAISTDGRDNRYYVPTTKTDEQGNYELKFIRAGEQRIQTDPFWLAPDQPPTKSSRTLTLKAGEEIEGVELASQ